MFRKIVNPKTGRKVNINSKIGKKVLKKYIIQLGGLNNERIAHYSEKKFRNWFNDTFYNEYGEDINRTEDAAEMYIPILRARALYEYKKTLTGPGDWAEYVKELVYDETSESPFNKDTLDFIIEVIGEKYFESESDSESDNNRESDFESESEEEVYSRDLTADDLEVIADNKIMHGKRKRKKTKFLKDMVFTNGRYDPYERSSGFERNNWFGRKGENTRVGSSEDYDYYSKKNNEKGYKINKFVVDSDSDSFSSE